MEMLEQIDALLSLPTSEARLCELRQLRPRLADLTGLSSDELEELDHRMQAMFHDWLLESAPGAERGFLFSAAYTLTPAILGERRRRHGQPIDRFGIAPNTERIIAAQLGPPPQRVLDVGCGTGILVEKLAEMGYDTLGIELSPVFVAEGRRRLGKHAEGKERLVEGDFLSVELDALGGAGAFDLIWSNDVLEHLHPSDAHAFLQRCRILLKRSGTLWLITPSGLTTGSKKTLHLKQYFLHELVDLGRAAGFDTFRSRLVGTRRRWAWPANARRREWVTIKVGAEKLIQGLPSGARKRLARLFAYSEILMQPQR